MRWCLLGDSDVRLTAWVHGYVQGVGFRWWTRSRALELGLTGFVREVPLPFVVPWSLLAVTAVVVPLVAALAAVLLTRSRLPLVRRLV